MDTNFGFSIDSSTLLQRGASADCNGTSGLMELDPTADHEIRSFANVGYDLERPPTCSIAKPNGTAENVTADAENVLSVVNLDAGDDVTCQFDFGPATSTFTLVLDKCLINDDGGTATPADFLPSTVNGVNAIVSQTNCAAGAAGARHTYPGVPTGFVTVTENLQSGYVTESPWSCGQLSNDGFFFGIGAASTATSAITFGVASSATEVLCQTTNDDIGPAGTATITLVKCVVDPDYVVSASSNLSGYLATLPTNACPTGTTAQAATGPISANPGPFGLAEVFVLPVTGPYNTGDWICTGGGTAQAGSIDLVAGQDVTCHFTETWFSASIKLVRCVEWSGVDGRGAADFSLSGNALTTEPVDATCSANTDSQASVQLSNIPAGPFALAETTATGYTATGWKCTGAEGTPTSSSDLSTTIELNYLDDVTCSITNTEDAAAPTAQITLIKCVRWQGASGAPAQLFTLSGQPLEATVVGAPCPPDTDSQARVTVGGVPTGAFVLSETNLPGFTAGGWNCAGATTGPTSASAATTVDLRAGDSVTCHITNTEDAPVPPTTDDPDELPSLALETTATYFDANSDGVLGVGETATFVFDVTNDGTVTVDNVVVSDSLPGLSEVTCPESFTGSLQPQDTVRCIATYVAAASDIATGSIQNSATVTGDGPNGDGGTISVDAPASVSIELAPNPALSIKLTANAKPPYQPGQTIEFNVLVANTGGTTLTDIVITDNRTGLNTTIDALAVGQSANVQTTYTIAESDLAAGSFINTASAAATQLATAVEATASLTITPPPTTAEMETPPPTVLGTQTTSPVVSGIIAVGGADSDLLLIVATALLAAGFAWRIVSTMTELVPLRTPRQKNH